MFTGIITHIGRIIEVRPDLTNGLYLKVSMSCDVSAISIGASLAHNGVCLTVIDKGDTWLAYDVSPETLDCTTVRNWKINQRVNIEPALKLGDELGGHLVLGHVDGMASIGAIEMIGTSYAVSCDLPHAVRRFIAPKGSVTLDGVSLTVNRVEDEMQQFTVMIVPHTWRETVFSDYRVGDRINLEIDPIARYIARQMVS